MKGCENQSVLAVITCAGALAASHPCAGSMNLPFSQAPGVLHWMIDRQPVALHDCVRACEVVVGGCWFPLCLNLQSNAWLWPRLSECRRRGPSGRLLSSGSALPVRRCGSGCQVVAVKARRRQTSELHKPPKSRLPSPSALELRGGTSWGRPRSGPSAPRGFESPGPHVTPFAALARLPRRSI